MTTTTRYIVENTRSGLCLGVYATATADEAIRAMLANAGCTDEPDADLVATEVPTLVEAGAAGSEDWDYGAVLDVEGDGRVTVAWRGSNEKTTVYLSTVRDYDGVEKWAATV